SATELRALSHPTRLALLEALDLNGPLTATEAGELVGESPSSCSFHLRTLARYGYVEGAEGGRGRQRPWKTVPQMQEVRADAAARRPARLRRHPRRPHARPPGHPRGGQRGRPGRRGRTVRSVLARRELRVFLGADALSLTGSAALWLALGIWAKSLTGSSAAA